jgi:copper chaperone CopZ
MKTCLLRVQVPGVVSVSVNLATNTALIAYDPAVTGPRSCLEAVESAGFDASLANTGAHAACLCGVCGFCFKLTKLVSSAARDDSKSCSMLLCAALALHVTCMACGPIVHGMQPNSASLPVQDREQ